MVPSIGRVTTCTVLLWDGKMITKTIEGDFDLLLMPFALEDVEEISFNAHKQKYKDPDTIRLTREEEADAYTWPEEHEPKEEYQLFDKKLTPYDISEEAMEEVSKEMVTEIRKNLKDLLDEELKKDEQDI